MLRWTGLPFVIENVVGAPLQDATMLCGSMFGLGSGEYQLRRHRLFEPHGFEIWPLIGCHHYGKALPVYGHAGGRSKRDGLTFPGTDAWREGMGIDWMTGKELAEAIPPAYTESVGGFLFNEVMLRASLASGTPRLDTSEWVKSRLAALAETFSPIPLDLPLTDGPRLADEPPAQLAVGDLPPQRRSRQTEMGGGLGEGEHLAGLRGGVAGGLVADLTMQAADGADPDGASADGAEDVGRLTLDGWRGVRHA